MGGPTSGGGDAVARLPGPRVPEEAGPLVRALRAPAAGAALEALLGDQPAILPQLQVIDQALPLSEEHEPELGEESAPGREDLPVAHRLPRRAGTLVARGPGLV